MTRKQKDTAPAVQPPGYGLPEKLEAHASTIAGSEPAEACIASASFIRQLIAENTTLKTELTRQLGAMQKIKNIVGGF